MSRKLKDSEPPSKRTEKTKRENLRISSLTNLKFEKFIEEKPKEKNQEYIPQKNNSNSNENERGYSMNPKFRGFLDFLNDELASHNSKYNLMPAAEKLFVISCINIPKERDYRKEYADDDEPERPIFERGLGRKLDLNEYQMKMSARLNLPFQQNQSILLIKDLAA